MSRVQHGSAEGAAIVCARCQRAWDGREPFYRQPPKWPRRWLCAACRDALPRSAIGADPV